MEKYSLFHFASGSWQEIRRSEDMKAAIEYHSMVAKTDWSTQYTAIHKVHAPLA